MHIFSWIVLIIISFATEKGTADHDEPSYDDYDSDYSEPSVTESSEQSVPDSSDNCICVPFFRCENGIIIEDGEKKIKPRRPSSGVGTRNSSPKCPLNHICCRPFESRKPTEESRKPPENPHLHHQHKCGTRNVISMSNRVMNAQATAKTEFGDWPWQAAILKPNGREYGLTCGGTLIDEQHVLTAAHCVSDYMNDFGDLIVRLGEYDSQKETEPYPHENVGISDIIIHPEYRSSNYQNDIAILKLRRQVIYKPHIDIVCLPRDEDDFTSETCVVTGWGQDAFEHGTFSNVMRKVSLPVIGHSECQNKMRGTALGHFFKLHGGFLCAGGKEGEDACTGDGGGPLVCVQPDNTYILAGIVSWGLECGAKDVPGVYVNVQKYINWISSNTGKPVEAYWRKD